VELQKRISKKALSVWRINGLIHTGIYMAIAALLTFLAMLFEWPGWAIIIFWGIAVLRFVYSVIIFPALSYKQWRYEVRGTEIEFQQGLFIVERTLVPMVRVQHVDISQGPIMKKYGLSSIGISTAATVHEIPALENQEAEELRHYISRMVQRVKEDV